jgi:hypothetical protein
MAPPSRSLSPGNGTGKAGTPSPPALRVMVAGVDRDARGAVEDSVRRALGSQADRGPWSISVVSMAGKWSVTLDGPGDRLRGVSFVAEPSRLADAIREAVGVDPETPARIATPTHTLVTAHAPPAEVHDHHQCEHCGAAVVVVYEQRPGESKELAALACPHCWRIGHVEVGAWAAAGQEYRAEKG